MCVFANFPAEAATLGSMFFFGSTHDANLVATFDPVSGRNRMRVILRVGFSPVELDTKVGTTRPATETRMPRAS